MKKLKEYLHASEEFVLATRLGLQDQPSPIKVKINPQGREFETDLEIWLKKSQAKIEALEKQLEE